MYGRRTYDPEKFSSYEQQNGVSDEREEELAYLVRSHWKEDVGDGGWRKPIEVYSSCKS